MLPSRVLPISTRAPNDITIMLADEIEEIRRLLKPGRRQRVAARARARTLTLMEHAIEGIEGLPADSQLDALLARIASGEDARAVFPGVAALRLSIDGEGIDFSIRISKSEGLASEVGKGGHARRRRRFSSGRT